MMRRVYLSCILLLAASQAVSSSSCQQNKLDIVAVLDGSGSIGSDDFIKQKNAVIQLAQSMNLGYSTQMFGALVYSSSVTNTISLSSSISSLKSRMNAVSQPGGGTNTHLGIQSMQSMLSGGRSGAKKVGIVITDGQSTAESLTRQAAINARNAGITMFAIGVGGGVKTQELHNIASSASYVVTLSNFGALATRFKTLITKICVVDGGWSSWSSGTRGPCSEPCGPGHRTLTKTRTCTNPRPSTGGQACSGSPTLTSTETCNVKPCPVHGRWSGWSSPVKGKCSTTCDAGTLTVTRTRTCRPPKHGGQSCGGSGTTISYEQCNLRECPIDGGWTTWTTISRSTCSATCGGGVITVLQDRNCTNPEPEHGGKDCPGSRTNTYTVPCNTFGCPSCDGCAYENGVGFLPHPSDCRFYVQCFSSGASYMVRQCPRGTYWDQDLFTCMSSSAVNCTIIAPVVPLTQSGAAPPPPPPPADSSPASACPLRAIPGQAAEFEESSDVDGWVKKTCSPGTVFSAAECACVHGGQILSTQACTAEVYLPLKSDVKDYSNHKIYVENKGLKTKGGVIEFVKDDFIRIPRLSNLDFGKTIDISFNLRSRVNTTMDEALVSNAECGQTGSINIILKPAAIEFRVRSDKDGFTEVTVPLKTLPATVRLSVHKGVMRGEVNGAGKKAAFKGRVAMVACALQIGRGTNYEGFNGVLQDFKLSLCNP